MPPARHWCGYAWESIGDGRYHECLVVGRHDVHECADDGCEQSSPVNTGGGRQRNHHGRPG